jgi:hypothetical protein
MDGAAIRELSAEQRSLVDELTRAAIDGAEVTNPTASLREDVTATLQAAIADPDVADRLGHLAKAEQWSGFADFGASMAVSTAARSGKAKAEATPATDDRTFRTSRQKTQISTGKERSRRQSAEAREALAAAERAKADADNEMSDRQTDLAVARLRRDEMRQRLEEAERNLDAAEKAYDAAKQASRAAAESVKEAKARLRQAERTT